MNIEELRNERQKLENNLTQIITDQVDIFRKNTGLSPNSINVNMELVLSYGDKEPQYIVTGVRVDVPL